MRNRIPEIGSVIRELNLNSDFVEYYGKYSAKVSDFSLGNRPSRGKLILVSAITPTPAGEGKTTVSIGLAQGLRKLGYRTALALRQPSMGPVFGRKGTATGGGRSSLIPSDSINLHFTGDFHAITTAHNLLAAALDNGLYFKTLRIDPSKVLWKRVIDMNDRALRHIQIGLTDQNSSGRNSAFDITSASEIMAILCLSENYDELRDRLNRILVGFTPDMEPVFASQIRVTGALLAVLREALKPNIVQSSEGVPAFIHGGPFANIAHGCNSILATKMALENADYVVTEAGFAFDLGGEKFLDIKCRQGQLAPDAIVLVVTIRALKMHDGIKLADLPAENASAVFSGLENLEAHLAAAKFFKRPITVAINRFSTDTSEEISVVQEFCRKQGIPCEIANVFSEGGDGALSLATCLVTATQQPSPRLPFVYALDETIETKIEKISKVIYGADGVDFTTEALDRLRITVRDFEISNGAGFLVALTGKLLRMPALPKVPSAERIQMDSQGVITGW